MTRDEWLGSDDPEAMLEFLHPGDEYKTIGVLIDSKRDRKFRLFACAVARRQKFSYWSSIHEAELRADGYPPHDVFHAQEFTATTLQENAHYAAKYVVGVAWAHMASFGSITQAEKADTLRDTFNPFADFPWDPAWVSRDALMVAQAAYADRLKKVPAGISGITGQAVAVSVEHDTGVLDPQALRELSDCLEEAGCPTGVECLCENAVALDPRGPGGQMIAHWCRDCQNTGIKPHPVIEHLRSPGPHYRGMWSLDIVLGKS